MTAFLPDNLLALFAPRPPIPFRKPIDELLVDRNEKRPTLSGIAEYVHLFEDATETPPKAVVETKEEKRARRRKEKEELLAYKIEQGIAMWNPAENESATKDPYKTLFISRINYETSESKLKREFESFGRIEKLVMVSDKNDKPRGYAFIEYRDKNDMHAAYKKSDGLKIDGRRVVVDYERGRTQKTWLPRRLGGGKGDTRRTKESRATLEARAELVDRERAPSGSREKHAGSRHRSRSRERETSRRDERPDRERRDRDRDVRGGGGGGGRDDRDRHRSDDRNGRDRPDRPDRRY